MEDKDTRYNPLDGIVALPLEEYSRLVRASERLEVVKQLYESINTAYDLEKVLKPLLLEKEEVVGDE